MALLNRLIATTLPIVPKFIVGRVAARYVAGETLEDAVRVIQQLNAEGAMATVDLLGEEVNDRSAAMAAVDEYRRVLDAIRKHQLDCNISVKPTQVGLKIDEGLCRESFTKLVEAADGIFVRLDMEDHTTTDATIRIYRHLRERTEATGTVFQAYMHRTLQDIAELPPKANIRLCKGIYIEPRAIAWQGYETVRRNFVAALEKALRQGVYVGIATHDEYLVCAAVELLDRLGINREHYEFQMLLGVEPALRRILLEGGHRLRVYVPYGRDWYLYSVRRLRENPEIAGHVLRALLRGDA